MSRRLVPRLGDWIFLLVFIASLLLGQRMLNTDADLGRHLTLGGIILDTRSVPVTDMLSYTKSGESRPPYEWLAQLVFAIANRLLGLDGVVLLTCAIIAGAFCAVYTDALGRSGFPLLSMTITLLASITSSLHWLTRPHVFSFLFLAIWMTQLERLRTEQTSSIWSLPLLMLVWANTHGGFIFGFLAWFAYVVGASISTFARRTPALVLRRMALAGGLALGASVVTPAWWHSWAAVFGNRSTYVLSRTVETMMPSLAAPSTWLFAGFFLAAAAVLIWTWRGAVLAQVLLLCGFGLAAILMARNVPLFAIAAAPVLASSLARALKPGGAFTRLEARIKALEASFTGWLLPGIAAALIIAAVAGRDSKAGTDIFQYDPQIYPVGAATWLKSHAVDGEMFNDLNWGGYLLYSLWPAHRVFIDSQTDFYGESFTRLYENMLLARPGWDAEMSRFGVGWAILPSSAPLAGQLAMEADWREAYRDGTASIFVRGSER